MQLSYNDNTNQSFPKNEFPPDILLGVNGSYYSNETEVFRLLVEIIQHYIEKERKNVESPET